MSRFESDPDRLAFASVPAKSDESIDEEQFRDDQLRLIFTCCHPSLPSATRVAMTLREMCGLTTEEVACAFLTSPATIAQRIAYSGRTEQLTPSPDHDGSTPDLDFHRSV